MPTQAYGTNINIDYSLPLWVFYAPLVLFFISFGLVLFVHIPIIFKLIALVLLVLFLIRLLARNRVLSQVRHVAFRDDRIYLSVSVTDSNNLQLNTETIEARCLSKRLVLPFIVVLNLSLSQNNSIQNKSIQNKSIQNKLRRGKRIQLVFFPSAIGRALFRQLCVHLRIQK